MSFFDSEVGPAMEPRSSGSAAGLVDATHQGVREQLCDYLDNSLPEGDRARVSEHLQHCRACRAYESTLRATTRAVAGLPREGAPESARERLRRIAHG